MKSITKDSAKKCDVVKDYCEAVDHGDGTITLRFIKEITIRCDVKNATVSV